MIKFKAVILLVFVLVVNLKSTAQVDMNTMEHNKYSEAELQEYKAGKLQEHTHVNEEYIFVPAGNERIAGTANTQVVPQCSNMDFETGTFQNWTRLNGYNPLFNAVGCCSFTNQLDITLMTGAGLDPLGGFPVVCPSGGSVTARIGSTAIGGRADRLEQTFSVSATNPILKINYAAVLFDGGHSVASQPRITLEALDSLGNQLPCSFLNISNSTPLISWSSSTVSTNVVYSNWTSHIIDLGLYIGQKITFRATAYDCGPSGHYGYTYLDIDCVSNLGGVSTTLCPITNTNPISNLCSPYPSIYPLWAVPQSTIPIYQNCISVNSPGVYTCYPSGCFVASGAAYTCSVSFYPPIQLTKTISDTISCNGTISFSSTASAGTSTLSGTWYFGDSTFTAGNQAIHTYTSAGNHIAKYVVQAPSGCRDSVTQLIRTLSPPTANFLSDTVCSGGALTFTNLSSTTQGSILSSSWATTTFSISSSGAPSVQSFSLPPGSYPFTLTVNSGYDCVSSFSQTALVLPTPQATIVMQPTFCASSTITYSYNSALPSNSIASSSWTLPLLVLSSVASPTQIIYTAGTYSANLSITSQSACAENTQISFTVLPLPTVAIAGGSICAGDSFTFFPTGANQYSITGNNFVVSPTISTTYSLIGTSPDGCLSANTSTAQINVVPLPSLSINSGTICNGSSIGLIPSGANNYTITGNNFVVSPSVTTVYTLTGKNASGCYAASPVTSTVTVYPLPIVSLNSGSACVGSIYTLQAQGASQYSYSIPNPSFQVVTSGTFSVLGADTNGCLNSASATVIAFPKPSAFIQQNRYTVCETEVVTFTAFGATNYIWNIGGGSATKTVQATLTGTNIFAIATNTFGCSDTAYAYINVNALPVLSVVCQPTLFCAGEVYTLTASGAQNYFWPPITSTPVFTAHAAPSISQSLTGTSLAGCKSTFVFSLVPEACAGLPSQQMQEMLRFSCQNNKIIFFSPCSETLKLIDNAGRMIEIHTDSAGQHYVDTSELAAGIYLCAIYCDGKTMVKKLLVNSGN